MNRSNQYPEAYTEAEHDKALGRLMADVKGHGVKHTPGPWTVSGLPEIYGHDCINANGPEPVATVLRRFVRAENEANARLIAAAPELLTACELLVARLDLIFKAGVVPDSLDKAALSAGLAAIRKAQGGEA